VRGPDRASSPGPKSAGRPDDEPGMARFLTLVLVIGAIYFAANRVDIFGGGPRIDGDQVVVESRDLEFHFQSRGPVADSYMVFGGTVVPGPNGLGDVVASTLSMDHARSISRSYPDFHLCKSPGAAQAKRFTKSTTFFAADRRARSALKQAVALHDERVRSGGERTCLSVEGVGLRAESILVSQDGSDITQQFRRFLDSSRLVLAQSAQVVDCSALLR
jgi:hypothetical protein